MSNWYEQIPYGPLTEEDYIKLGSVLYLSDPNDAPLVKAAIKVAEQRLAFPKSYLEYSIKKATAELLGESVPSEGKDNV